ncbi:hypothetical protein DB29_01615 [Shouchella clausii]|nr:hypothetical protein DB29_01615 [Shouchella clausii]
MEHGIITIQTNPINVAFKQLESVLSSVFKGFLPLFVNESI